MSSPLWVTETAEAFWAEVGEPEQFPRNLRQPIARALPLAIVSMPRLSVAGVEVWLQRQAVHCRVGVEQRALRACLVAGFGHGIILVDGSDPESEQRFSVAHELAHFLRDYWRPRHVAVERLGAEIVEVLDGVRPARDDERVHGLLGRVELGIRVHLMERMGHGRAASAAVAVAENDADRLAFELLAPIARIAREVGGYPPHERRDEAVRLLTTVYGLPASQAVRYALSIVPEQRPSDSLLRRLGLLA